MTRISQRVVCHSLHLIWILSLFTITITSFSDKTNAAEFDLSSSLESTTSSSSSSSSSPSSSSSSLSRAQSIKWDLQLKTTRGAFHGLGMCKGTTNETRKVGFLTSFGSVWRTLDGVNWKEMVKFPSSVYWYGVYCFPDAQRVLAIGFTNGDQVLGTGPLIAWSFDGGETWGERFKMTGGDEFTWLQSAHFYNDTHGILLPFIQSARTLAYHTTNGGKTAADWNAVQLQHRASWKQNHPVQVFGDVTKTFADAGGGGPKLCESYDTGETWPTCTSVPVVVGSFATPNEAIGVGGGSAYSSVNGGKDWKSLSSQIPARVDLLRDMLWIPNSDVVVVVGGNNWDYVKGAVAHSTDRGVTWVTSMPDLLPTVFESVDSVQISETLSEVWAVGWNDESSIVLHATVTRA